MNRRTVLKLLSLFGVPFISPRGWSQTRLSGESEYDVLVIGAGVFGIWTAYHLHKQGKSVAIIDTYHAAHSASSSGGESRVTRCGYGDAELYSDWAYQSIDEWQKLSTRAALPLYHETGVLWLHGPDDAYVTSTMKTLDKKKITYQQFDAKQLGKKYPVLNLEQDHYGFYEPKAGAIMARRAVQTLAAELHNDGIDFLNGRIMPIYKSQAVNKALLSVETSLGNTIKADQFVFACGPWLNKVCPEAMQDKLFVTRQEVLYFAAADKLGKLPVWADLPFYGIPDFEGRGFKIANDTHGAYIDPDTENRRLSDSAEQQAREFLARRFPAIAESPLQEFRVCQYENSSNGDFVIDLHPGLENVLVVGCGSGHGFKHGPAVGRHVAELVTGKDQFIEQFSLRTKQKIQKREVQ